MWSNWLSLTVFLVLSQHGKGAILSGPNGVTTVGPGDAMYKQKPYVNGAKTFHGGVIREYSGKTKDVTSPILDKSTGERAIIGQLAQMTKDDTKDVLASAKEAWSNGMGKWPQMTVADRIAALQKVVESLKENREDIVNALMWEICKNSADAASEFDRTMKFIESTINAYKKMDLENGSWRSISGILSRVRRAAIGIMLCLGPFNYPFNETYATLIPALLAGNVVIMKVPNTGGLAHILTMDAYAKHLPPGVINFFSGSGRETMGPLMSTGDIDILAFIGGSKAADAVIQAHPHPHRLNVFLQLEGKNLGIVLPDADLDVAAKQIVKGSTSYNGQRCTAIKLVFVHRSVVDAFLPKFLAEINGLGFGLPWEEGVAITPLPEANKIAYLQSLIDDAKAKGAAVINANDGGGSVYGNLMRPAVLYPVGAGMRAYAEEQFGPVVPVAVYDDVSEIYGYLKQTPFGQQAAIFSSSSASSSASSSGASLSSGGDSPSSGSMAELLDVLSTVVGRVNINTQCARSPDVLPFTGRRSSALGAMSVTEAIRAFSVEVVVAGTDTAGNSAVMKGLDMSSKFLHTIEGSNSNDDKEHEL